MEIATRREAFDHSPTNLLQQRLPLCDLNHSIEHRSHNTTQIYLR